MNNSMLNYVNKVADQAIKKSGQKDYLAIINAVSDKEAFAVAIAKMDEVVGSKDGDFKTWVARGYSHSKRAGRIFDRVMSTIKTPEAKAVLTAKQNYLYSVCEGRNLDSTHMYKANRSKFMAQAVDVLKSM